MAEIKRLEPWQWPNHRFFSGRWPEFDDWECVPVTDDPMNLNALRLKLNEVIDELNARAKEAPDA